MQDPEQATVVSPCDEEEPELAVEPEAELAGVGGER
jgi:hypothetical protein